MAARTVSSTGADVDCVEVKVKKKGLRKISAAPWLKNRRLMGVKSTKTDKAVPCCGVSVAGESDTIVEGRQFEDKSVQCDDLLPADHGYHRYGVHGNSVDRCTSCCHPINPIYQTNVIVNQIPFMDDEPDDVSLPTFRRNHHPIRHRRNSRAESAPHPPQPLFRKNNLFAAASLQNEVHRDTSQRHSSVVLRDDDQQDCNGSLSQSEISIPNSIDYDLETVAPSKPRVPLRRRTGAYGNVTLNVQIANGINTAILEADERELPTAVPRRRYGTVAPDRATIRESCREPSQSSCLVLGINSDARNPLNYKMYTPFYNKRQTMPPEHFKNWPSESRFGDDNDRSYRTLSYYSDVANQLEQYERRSFDAGSSCMLNAIDSNSIMYRSSMDNLPNGDQTPQDRRKQSRMENDPSVGKTGPTVVLSSRSRADSRAKNKSSDQIPPAQPQSNLLAPPTSAFGRWSGSIQNLFSIGNRASSGTGRWSKSENCLNEVGQQTGKRIAGPAKPSNEHRVWSDRLFGRTTVAAGRGGRKGRARRTNTLLTSGGGSFFTYKYDDEEESAWQKYFSLGMLRKIRPKQGKPTRGKDGSIQDLDGSFFEKFGSILRQKSIQNDESVRARLQPFPDENEPEAELNDPTTLPPVAEAEDSGTETLLDESDSEDQQQEKQAEFIEDVFGWNIEELYEEILFENIHNIGCDDEELNVDVLFPYIQEAFKMSDEKHNEILQIARNKEAPEIRLNVEIVEAKDLEPKDSNGLSDPFVTMYIASNPNHRYNTSVKAGTLNPVWEEHFSLPIAEDANDANLIVEVWDFDPAETVKEKMNKLFEVKGVRGLRKLMKEIAQTASSGKHDNELIGRTSIPLKSIPASGMLLWYNLDKKNKLRRQGTIRIRLNFSSEKNSQVAAQEHRHLLRILLLHELESSKVAPYWWSGKFTIQGEAVLTQHSAQSGLSSTTEAFIQWSVFAAIHQDHPLSFVLFDTLLEKLIRPIQTLAVSEEELKTFWDATKKLLPSCFSAIRKLRKKNTGDKLVLKTLNGVLNIIAKVALLEPPEGTDLFPVQMYGWIRRSNDSEPNWDIREALASAVVSGAEDWFSGIKEGHFLQTGTDEDRLQNLIKIIQLVRSDIQKSIEYYDKTFQEIMHFPYTKELYITYELKLAELIKPTVEDICRKLKRIDLPETGSHRGGDSGFIEYEDINMGTTLFELYLVLKRFCTLGTALSPGESNFAIDEYHRWFTTGVTHWLDIAVYKALTRIHKAIELDKLQPVDETVKYSSSAVDTLAIFYQIKIFWQQLAWPDVEGAYIFVAKIVDDICRCCVFYADRMSARVENLGVVENVYEKKFEVTSEWCLAINNIDYIRQSLKPFATELGVDDILAKLGDVQSSIEAERCKETLRAVLDNAIDTEKNKILDLVEKLARKMAPAMRRFLVEGAELLQQDSNSLDRLMMYMEESLSVLNAELNETNFERVLDAIWAELTTILYDLIQSNLDKRRPPSFFANLRDTLHLMVANFKTAQNRESETAADKETLAHIERLLQLHGYETTDLIHQYYLDRLEEQNQSDASTTGYGMLTVQCFFKENVLELEIVNARNLKPMDGNGSCDPFVRVHFLPEERFVGVAKPKTQCQSKTLFPLFDEKFVITFTPEQRSIENAVIMFSIKDKDLFGMSNQYLAECYLGFNEIADISGDAGKIEQKHLILTRPQKMDIDCLRALEYRQGDKQAKEFIKKLKQKMGQ
ncbi:protein unc-13 homolog 4B isoform X1 [Anopheles stephensi]|uniref:protein unc-13 homolog 4B isoform X1 n=1 Tax=Anopheles stephensi TaxID=30069 RepID=UPI001658AF3C|nr:protein unc-13 homolog 4B isoform X1 [Anopheles stephensi]